jgi:hypothetical protein
LATGSFSRNLLTRYSTSNRFNIVSRTYSSAKPVDDETRLLVELYRNVKNSTKVLKKGSAQRRFLEKYSAEEIVSRLSSNERVEMLKLAKVVGTGTPEESHEAYITKVVPAQVLTEQLEADAMSREESMAFLSEAMPRAYEDDVSSEEAEFFRRNLDTRVSHISSLLAMAEGNLETTRTLVEQGLTLRVLDMVPHSLKNYSVMCILLKAFRVLATQELAVDQMLHSPIKFIATLVSLLKCKNVSVRIEASAVIGLLTIVRDAVFALKQQNVVASLTSILSSPIAANEQALFNNCVVAFVRIIGVSGETIADDLKKEQAVAPFCNIINKLDRSPAVHDAVVTLLTILAGSPEISLQIVSAGCVPSLSKILTTYVDYASGKVSERDFRRITSSAYNTRPAIEENDEVIVDDDEAIDDYVNPIYRGSDPEDIIPLIRLLSRVPRARSEMLTASVPTALAALIAIPTLPFSQKTQATNCLANFASDPSAQQVVLETDVVRLLAMQTFDAGTSLEELTFQNHALAVLALLSAHEAVQKHTSQKYWLTAVIPRAAKVTEKPVQQAIGSILLNLLRGPRQDDIREIIAASDPIRNTIAFMIRADQSQEQGQRQRSVWTSVYSLT